MRKKKNMKTNDPRSSSDAQCLEALLRQFQPAQAKASIAETFYRAGYAAAAAEPAARSGLSRWLQYGFFSGLASGIAASLMLWAGWQSFRSQPSDPRMMAGGSATVHNDRASNAPKDADVSRKLIVEPTPVSPAEAEANPRMAVSGLAGWIFGMETDRPTPTQRTIPDDRNIFHSSLSYLQSQQWDRTQKAGRSYATRSTSTPGDAGRASGASSERADLKSLWRSIHDDELGL